MNIARPRQRTGKTGKARRVVFFGLGSIGSRLARLVSEDGPHEILAFRSGAARAAAPQGVTCVSSWDELDRLSPEAAFIANPTTLHVSTALACAERGMHLFVEKPLSDRLDGIDRLLETAARGNLVTLVGCNLRFDPLLDRLRAGLRGRSPFFARAICSSFLPFWRPAQDYRRSYSARRDLGGGVLLDLVHEPDYCHALFGPIESIEGTVARRSGLQIETEDLAELTLAHRCGMRTHVHLDYFGLRRQRKIEMFGEGFYGEADFVGRTLLWIENGRTRKRAFPPLPPDATYREEIRHFFRCIDRGEPTVNDLREHVQVLYPILAFRRAQGGESS